MSQFDQAQALLAALPLEDGRLWGDVATPWQWAMAEWLLDPKSPPNRWESRPRGGSKTTDVAAVSMVALASTLPAGTRAYVAAVDRDQARLVADAAAGFASRSRALASVLTVDAYKITSSSGSVLEILAADAASSWGLKPSLLVCDEFCQWPNTPNARGLWQALVSAMGKVKGAKLLIASTSGDPGHWSRKVYDAAQRSKAWTVQDTPGPLPWVSEDFLAEQRALLPDSVYRRLHLNEWCAPEDRLTSLDDLKACAILPGPLEPAAGHSYVVAVDLGLKHDRSVATVMHAEGNAELGRCSVMDRMEVWTGTPSNPVDLGTVEEWIEFTAKRYHARVIIDPWQGVGMMQRLQRRGCSVTEFVFSAQSVGRLAMALHTAIRDHHLAIPADEELIAELANVRLRETSPNVYRLDHASGEHDDRAVALALGLLHLTTASTGATEWLQSLVDEQSAEPAPEPDPVQTLDARTHVPDVLARQGFGGGWTGGRRTRWGR